MAVFNRDRSRNWLATVGVVGVFLAFMPFFEYRGGTVADAAQAKHVSANLGDMPFVKEHRFGWAGSPLMHYRTELRLQTLPDGACRAEKTMGFEVNLLSWSFLTLAVGIGLTVVAGRIRPAAGPA